MRLAGNPFYHFFWSWCPLLRPAFLRRFCLPSPFGFGGPRSRQSCPVLWLYGVASLKFIHLPPSPCGCGECARLCLLPFPASARPFASLLLLSLRPLLSFRHLGTRAWASVARRVFHPSFGPRLMAVLRNERIQRFWPALAGCWLCSLAAPRSKVLSYAAFWLCYDAYVVVSWLREDGRTSESQGREKHMQACMTANGPFS